MKTEPNECAFPFSAGADDFSVKGLNKREYFASQAMIGIIANAPLNNLSNSKEGAQLCRQWADDLIEALNEDPL